MAQAYGDSVPTVVFPGGYPRRLTNIPPNFNAFLNFRHISKWIEQVPFADVIPHALRRAIKMTREGTPALLECITGKEIQHSIYK